MQYRIKVEMVPYGSNVDNQVQLFNTKREVLITKKGGLSSKHFMEEREADWANPAHNDWSCNSSIGLKGSVARIIVSIDRLFYYSGDKITM